MLMAESLQRVFNGGEIVWIFPTRHIGWRSPDGNVYDIDGKLDKIALPSEDEWEAIPVSYLTENVIRDYEKNEEIDFDLFIQESLKGAFRYRDDTPSFNFTNDEIIEMFRQSYDRKEERKIYEEAVNKFCYSEEKEGED